MGYSDPEKQRAWDRARGARRRSDPEYKEQRAAIIKKYQQSAHGKRVLWEATIRHKYGLEAEDVARAFDAQGGKCVCGEALAMNKMTHIDHDHVTGEFRGLLCNPCNRAMGYAKDNPDVLRRLAAYLEKSRGEYSQ